MTDVRRPRLYPNTVALREHVADLMAEQGLSARGVVKRHGPGLGYQAVYALVSGRTLQVRLSTLEALAKALATDRDILIKLTGTAEPWSMPAEFNGVPPEVRHATERWLATVLRAIGVLPPTRYRDKSIDVSSDHCLENPRRQSPPLTP